MKSGHELIVPNEDLPFKLFLFEGKNGNYYRERHWHNSIEIFALVKGSLTFYLNNKAFLLCPGEFMLINSNELHSVASPKANETIVLQIPVKAFAKYFTEENYIRFTHGERVQDKAVMKLLIEIYDLYKEKKLGYDLKVISKYYQLLYFLVAKYRKEEVTVEELKKNKQLRKLTPITGYIREHYQEDLSLQGVADIFGYSTTYLSHMFSDYIHIGFKAYVQSIRLEHAALELRTTNKTISEIAVDNGFANSKAFSELFKTVYKMLPSQYKKEIASFDHKGHN